MKLTTHKLQKAKELRKNGYSYPKIARFFGVCKSTIERWLKPTYKTKQYARIKKWYLKNRTKRLIEMRDYYEKNKKK